MGFFESLKDNCADEWRAYTRHEFVLQLGAATLPKPAFQTYLVQDYLFLIQFARAHALAVYKSTNLQDMRDAAAGVSAILDVEMDLHVRLCADWGLSAADLEHSVEAPQTIAYTRFVLEAGHAGDILDLMVALAPCMLGYAEIGRWLVAEHGKPEANHPYQTWINEYAGQAYQDVAQATLLTLEKHASELLTQGRQNRLFHLFSQATRLEAEFWQMGLTSV
uniref:TenA family protein n=1 Tax=Pararhizobium sp. IMCC3301 TaxID=3067904 RepID=UPI0027414D2A|nr:TenA family protein [Pararhizobium sp. IMCC3301]